MRIKKKKKITREHTYHTPRKPLPRFIPGPLPVLPNQHHGRNPSPNTRKSPVRKNFKKRLGEENPIHMGKRNHHSTTLDTWMAQVGRDSALSGSWRAKRGISAAEAASGNAAEDVEARKRPIPRKAVMGCVSVCGIW